MKTFSHIIITALLLISLPSWATIKLPALVGDNMVLQQNTKVNIWGWASPDETVKIEADWLNKEVSAVTGTDSLWKVQISTPKAGGPYSMIITGDNTITLNNILIGEVWVCSGQSNMEKPIGIQPGQKPVFNYEEEIRNANYKQIRLFHVPRKMVAEVQTNVEANWEPCTSKTIDSLKFSAAGYFFGRELFKELKVPIGLIDATWGGTRIEPWTPVEGFKMMPSLDSIYQSVQQNLKIEKHAPTLLYNGMIAPLTNYTVKGAVWYQGESNLMDVNDGLFYAEKMKALIFGWRAAWKNPEMPFYYVQIAPYHYFKDRSDRVNSPDELPLLWEAQTMSLSIPYTGMVVITDIVDDLSDIHPRDKQDVGKRLALVALAKSYGKKDIVYSGPKYKSMKTENDKILISFDYVDGGLIAKDNHPLTWFTIAGEDENFVPATAEIKGDKLVVYHEGLKNPIAVRFAWDEEAQPNFFNKAGLPAIPFRTDNWQINKK